MNKNILVSIIIVVAILVASWMIFTRDSSPDAPNNTDAVAIINGEEVSRFDFETVKAQVATQQGFDPTNLDPQIEAQINSEIIDSLVGQVLFRQKARELGLEADSAEVDAQLENIKSQFGSDEEFANALMMEGIDENELRDRINSGLITQVYLEQELNLSSVVATEAEVDALYAQVAASSPEMPPMSEIRDQLQSMATQQKQQELISALIDTLKSEAEIVILI